MVGVDPFAPRCGHDPYTLRELWWLAHGAWQPTTHLLAALANQHRDPAKSRPAQPRDFHPLEPRAPRGLKLTRGTVRLLKAFVKEEPGNAVRT